MKKYKKIEIINNKSKSKQIIKNKISQEKHTATA